MYSALRKRQGGTYEEEGRGEDRWRGREEEMSGLRGGERKGEEKKAEETRGGREAIHIALDGMEGKRREEERRRGTISELPSWLIK